MSHDSYLSFSSYLLKPEIMRRSEKAFDPFTESPFDGIIPATIKVKVLIFIRTFEVYVASFYFIYDCLKFPRYIPLTHHVPMRLLFRLVSILASSSLVVCDSGLMQVHLII